MTTQRPKEATDCKESQNDAKRLVNSSKENHPKEKADPGLEKSDNPPEPREKVEVEVRL